MYTDSFVVREIAQKSLSNSTLSGQNHEEDIVGLMWIVTDEEQDEPARCDPERRPGRDGCGSSVFFFHSNLCDKMMITANRDHSDHDSPSWREDCSPAQCDSVDGPNARDFCLSL